jgi:hypothetical protein
MNTKKKAKINSKINEQQEQFKVYGHEVFQKIKKLIKKGNIRRIIIKDEKDKVVLEIPVNFVLLGAVFAPIFAAVGALIALTSKYTIVVEKK